MYIEQPSTSILHTNDSYSQPSQLMIGVNADEGGYGMPRLSTRIAKLLGMETGDMQRGRLAQQRGMRAENRVMNLLEDEGWLVKQSLGSRGLHDIEAFRHGDRIFVQVKSGFAWPTQTEISGLAKRAARKGATAYVFHEHRGSICPFPVCRWCCSVGDPSEERCANCGQPF